MTTTVDLEKVAAIGIRCENCNRTNDLMEGARREIKFEFEFTARQWNCIERSLRSSLNSMEKAANKSEIVENVVMAQIWNHKWLLKELEKGIEDEYGGIKSTDEDCLKTIETWAGEEC